MISNIENKSVRNILRGAVQASSESELRTALSRLRRTATANDTYFAYRYLYATIL